MHYLISPNIDGPIVLGNGNRYSYAIVPVADYGEANLVVISATPPTAAMIQAVLDARANAARILAIKEEAQARIYQILTAWKQMNLTASAVYLQSLRVDDLVARQTWYETWNNTHATWTRSMFTWIAGGSIPANSPGAAPVLPTAPVPSYGATEVAQWGGMLTLFGRAKAIRTHSDALEADPNLVPNWPG